MTRFQSSNKKRRVKGFPLFFSLFLILFFLLDPSLHFSQIGPALEWHLLYSKIRDGLISKEEAQDKLKGLESSLRHDYLKNWRGVFDDSIGFPLPGYPPNAIGGKGGSGYRIQDYDFFDGNQHKGHPGHDIFIQDKNQDGLDDVTGKPVEVVSVCSGIVVSVNLNWSPPSSLRGGNYVWIYDPVKGRYFYYAHLNEIVVQVGQIVYRGDRLGTVGRTGLNAYPKKSPTHLHFAVHQSMAGYPKPMNPYQELKRGGH